MMSGLEEELARAVHLRDRSTGVALKRVNYRIAQLQNAIAVAEGEVEMTFKHISLLHAPVEPYHAARVAKVTGHAIVDLEGGDEEVLHLHAFGEDTGIEIRVDDAKIGIVIKTRDGMYRQAI